MQLQEIILLYATQSNTEPTVAISDAAGNISSPGENVASYADGVVWNSTTGNVSTVGSAGATSFYGTYDQAGNVWEWNEAFVTGSSRGVRGGSWNFDEESLRASYRNFYTPSVKAGHVGFRVASVPEPSTAVLVLLGGGAYWLMRRRKATL